MGRGSSLRKERSRLPAAYYDQLRRGPVLQGPTRAKYAHHTQVALRLIRVRWDKYCKAISEDPTRLLREGQANDYVVFFKWMLDTYPNVQKRSSLHNYWRRFKQIYSDARGEWMDENTVKTINGAINNMYDEYELSQTTKEKPVMTVNTLARLLRIHWSSPDLFYRSGREQVQTAFFYLLAAYTGQRPCSLLETVSPAIRAQLQAKADARQQALRDDLSADCHRHVPRGSVLQQQGEEKHSAQGPATKDCPRTTHGILYRDVRLFIIKSSVPGTRDPLCMVINVVHTKNEMRRPQWKKFVFYENEDLHLCPIAHLIAIAQADGAFRDQSLRHLQQLFTLQVPVHKESLELRWADSILDRPILRCSKRNSEGSYRHDLPFDAATTGRRLTRLGEVAGLPGSVTHYAFRRGTGNAIDGRATEAVRNQIMGHAHSSTFQYYIQQVVGTDVEAAFLDRPSRKDVLDLMGSMALSADTTAPTRLTDEQAAAILDDDEYRQLQRQNRQLEAQDAPTAVRVELKKAIKCFKVQWRKTRLAQARREHFETADSQYIQSCSLGSATDGAMTASVPPRPAADVSQELHTIQSCASPMPEGLSDAMQQDQRIQFIKALWRHCRGLTSRPRVTEIRAQTGVGQEAELPFEELCLPMQCVFCLGVGIRKTYERRNKLWDHVEKHHLGPLYGQEEAIECPLETCRRARPLQFLNCGHLKLHLESVHHVSLRPTLQDAKSKR